MGSKGSQTQQQAGTSTYTANPLTQAYGAQALGMAGQAAQSPFQLPVAPVAGFTDLQNQAFQQTQQQQGMAQPYYNQAQGLFNQSAAPISGSQINNYLDPYAGYVMANLREQQGQQMNDLTGKATQAAGGVGADRIGVAQGELARQQGLAQGQTLSGIYGNALSAAQQDAQRQQAAAYGIGNLGGAAQNAAMQGTNALYGMGSQQQQLNQAQLNAPYQNQLARIAFPYQNAQYLAGITGSLAGALGGTTQSNQNTVTTPAQPSIWSQLLGAGTAGVGALGASGGLGSGGYLWGSSPSFGGGNLFSGDAYGGSGSNPLSGLSPSDYGAARGGRIGFAPGGDTSTAQGEPAWMLADPTVPTIALHASQVQQPKVQFSQPTQTKSDSGGIGDVVKTVASIAPFFLSAGGQVGTTPYQAYADGGDTFGDRFDLTPDEYRTKAYDLLRSGIGTRAPASIPGGEPAPVGTPENPYREPPYEATKAWREGTAAAPMMGADEESPAPKATGLAAFSPEAAKVAEENKRQMQGATYEVPYKDLNHGADASRDFAKSPWTALINAGAGMMAGTSPFAGVNIGKGLLEGTKTLENQRTASREEESVNQRAKQLAMQADQHLRQYTQVTPAEMLAAEQKQNQLEAAGWQKGGENVITGDTTWFNPRTQESGKLNGKTGEWTPAGKGAPIAGNAPPAGTTPVSEPAPFNEPSLATNLAPPKSDIGFIGKGSPLAAAAKKETDTAIPAMTKAAQMLPIMEQDLAAMKLSMETLTKDADKDGFLSRLALQPGADFGNRLEAAKRANAAAIAAGLKPPFDPDKVAAAENIDKIQARMGMTFTSQISPRESFAGQQIGIKSTPGLTNSLAGFKRLISGFEAADLNARAEQKFFQNFLAANGHALGWRQAFEAQNPAQKFLIRGLINQLPSNLQDGLPEAIKQLRENPKKYKDIFNKFYFGTADFFLKGAV